MASTSRYDYDRDRLEIDILLEEDIIAELEDFAFLSQLGLINESYKLLETVLWRHIKHFPVVAEIGAFAIDNKDEDIVINLFVDVFGGGIQFNTEEQRQFLRTLALWTRNDLVANTIQAMNSLSSQDQEVDDALRYEHVLFAKPDITSTIQLQNIEIRLRAAAIESADDGVSNPTFEYAKKHFWRLERHSLFSEAVRIFSALSCGHEMAVQEIFALRQMYERLLKQFEPERPRSKERTPEAMQSLETIQVIFDLFHTQFAYLRVLASHASSPPHEVERLYSEVENLIGWLFQDLPYDKASTTWAGVWNDISLKVASLSKKSQLARGQEFRSGSDESQGPFRYEKQEPLKKGDLSAQRDKIIKGKGQALSPEGRELYKDKTGDMTLGKDVVQKGYEREPNASSPHLSPRSWTTVTELPPPDVQPPASNKLEELEYLNTRLQRDNDKLVEANREYQRQVTAMNENVRQSPDRLGSANLPKHRVSFFKRWRSQIRFPRASSTSLASDDSEHDAGSRGPKM